MHIAEATAEERAEYEESIKPFLTPFDAFAAAAVAGATPTSSTPSSPSSRQEAQAQPEPEGGTTAPMAVRIRLTRVGAKKQPSYRVVVADARSARDSRAIETLGHYNPRTEPIELNVDADKAKAWLAKGAQPSDTVVRLFKQAGILPSGK